MNHRRETEQSKPKPLLDGRYQLLALLLWGMKMDEGGIPGTQIPLPVIAGSRWQTGRACWCSQRSDSHAWDKQFDGPFQAGKAGFVLQVTAQFWRPRSLNHISWSVLEGWSKGLQRSKTGYTWSDKKRLVILWPHWTVHVSNDLTFGVLTCHETSLGPRCWEGESFVSKGQTSPTNGTRFTDVSG